MPAPQGRGLLESMYIFYEEFPATYVVDTITEFVVSSDGRSAKIAFYDQDEKTTFNMVSSLFKAIPLQNRSYDLASHVWTFIGVAGAKVVVTLESLKIGLPTLKIEMKKVISLADRINKSQLHLDDATFLNNGKPPEIKFNEADFFHAPPAPKGQISGEALYSALATLIGISVAELKAADSNKLKSFKRAASLKYHPDRNGGDSSKMSEFNMLWMIYTQS